jgi:hypothetical protein
VWAYSVELDQWLHFCNHRFDEAVQTVQSQHKVSDVQRFLPLTLMGQVTLLCVLGVSLQWFLWSSLDKRF